MRALLARHWRTVLGVVVGAGAGAAYAHFIGCRTGTCAITGNVWTAATFFGLTGGVVAMPERDRGRQEPRRSEPWMP